MASDLPRGDGQSEAGPHDRPGDRICRQSSPTTIRLAPDAQSAQIVHCGNDCKSLKGLAPQVGLEPIRLRGRIRQTGPNASLRRTRHSSPSICIHAEASDEGNPEDVFESAIRSQPSGDVQQDHRLLIRLRCAFAGLRRMRSYGAISVPTV